MKTSNKPHIIIQDLASSQTINREMNDAEFAQYEADQAAQATLQAKAEAKATAKAALLAQLGITEEQAKLLLS
jgi:hypothetical protein